MPAEVNSARVNRLASHPLSAKTWAMPTEIPEPVHNSSSQLWLVAGIPALLVLAFLVYTAISQARPPVDDAPENAAQEVEPPTSDSDK